MTKVIIVEKNSDIKSLNIKNFNVEELYKKCNFKKPDNFELKCTWEGNKKFSFDYVELWGKTTGKANTENKFDFPPPVDNDIFFGSCILTAKNNENLYIDLDIEEWNNFYEHLFGGFEDLSKTCEEDENEEDELENIPKELKTKSGYLKDDFVVDDDEILEIENDVLEELEFEDGSELSYEEYEYSDDE